MFYSNGIAIELHVLQQRNCNRIACFTATELQWNCMFYSNGIVMELHVLQQLTGLEHATLLAHLPTG